jgi:hypothetical protein
VAFFGPSDYVSSYDLIGRAKLVLVYNSSIGLEASILGAPVLCAGRARYTQAPTVFFPATREAYMEELHRMLQSDEIRVSPEFASNARRFLSYELYQASLDLSEFLLPYPEISGMAMFSGFAPTRLAENPGLQAICDGILHGTPFFLGGGDTRAFDRNGGGSAR